MESDWESDQEILRKEEQVILKEARRTKEDLKSFKRSSRRIILQGDPREFDIILSSISDEFDDALEIPSIKMLGLDARLLDVLRNPLVAHKDFEDSSSTYLLIFKEYQEVDVLQRYWKDHFFAPRRTSHRM